MIADKAVFNHVWKFLSADVSTIMTTKSSSPENKCWSYFTTVKIWFKVDVYL